MWMVLASAKQLLEKGVVVLQVAWSAPMQGCIMWIHI